MCAASTRIGDLRFFLDMMSLRFAPAGGGVDHKEKRYSEFRIPLTAAGIKPIMGDE